jgi:hypothetical protein
MNCQEQILKHIQNTVIRIGTLEDVKALVSLNHSWHKPNLANFSNGFLSVTYDNTFFEGIIQNNDLVVFVQQDKIEGYVLVNSTFETQHINKIKAEYLFNKPENSKKKIGYSYQILINKHLQGSGFFYHAQKEYFNFFKNKYEIFVSTVNKENLRSISAHGKADWNFIDTPSHYYIIERHLF